MTEPVEAGEPPKFYSCQHGESNTPDECFPPDAEPMPDDWYLSYPTGDPGLTDKASTG